MLSRDKIEAAATVTLSDFFVQSRSSDTLSLRCGAQIKVSWLRSTDNTTHVVDGGDVVDFDLSKGERGALVTSQTLQLAQIVSKLEQKLDE